MLDVNTYFICLISGKIDTCFGHVHIYEVLLLRFKDAVRVLLIYFFMPQKSIGLPDVHSGYGFAIGNMAAFDMSDPTAVVSPGMWERKIK